jgi:hypothetical protein
MIRERIGEIIAEMSSHDDPSCIMYVIYSTVGDD